MSTEKFPVAFTHPISVKNGFSIFFQPIRFLIVWVNNQPIDAYANTPKSLRPTNICFIPIHSTDSPHTLKMKKNEEEEKFEEKSPERRTASEIAKEIGEQVIVGITLGEGISRTNREFQRVASRSPRKAKSPEDRRSDHEKGIDGGLFLGGYKAYEEIKKAFTPEKSKSPTNKNQGKEGDEKNYYKTGGNGGE